MRGCMTENESGREKGEEGQNREERTAAHGKHMRCVKKLYRDAYTEEKGGGVDWRENEGGRDVEAGTG